MALPSSRDENATPANPVNSVLINRLQDMVIGMKRPELWRPSMPRATLLGSWSYPVGQLYLLSAAGGNACLIPLDAHQGDRITGCEVAAFGDGVVDVTYTLFKIGQTMAGTVTLATLVDSNRAAAWGVVNLTAVTTPTTLNAGEALYLTAIANAANARIGDLRHPTDRL